MSGAIPERVKWLAGVTLQKGNHEDLADGACAMEAVAYIAGEPHSDRPMCACPVLSSFLRRWNDDMPDADRAMLKPYIIRVIGTYSTQAVESRRSWLAFDWLTREYTSAWLDFAGLTKHADALRGAGELVGANSLAEIHPVLAAAEKSSWKSAAPAKDDDFLTYMASKAAGKDAARASASKVAYTAASDASWPWVVTRDAAWAAPWAVARDAAWAASVDSLAPLVKTLQASACRLLDRMIAVKS